MKNVWINSHNKFFLDDKSSQQEELPKGIYKLMYIKDMDKLYLEHIQEKFTFDYKIYGIETKFIERCIKTYCATNGNLGILLNGLKGTGKTVTAQKLCNQFDLPVIIVHQKWDEVSIPAFINSIQQDVVIFFDEYEKIYNHYDDNILTVMDGVLNNGFRRVFLLTTNKMHINENMLQRPSRIRYINTFTDLKVDVITEIVEDKLQHVEFKEEIINFISNLEAITVDIVKAIVDEVNIHQEPPSAFKDIFNLLSSENLGNIYVKDQEGWKIKYPEVKVSHLKFENSDLGNYFLMNGNTLGEIRHIISDYVAIIALEDELDENNKPLLATYRIEKLERRHKNFIDLVF
jgi:SpoVK/Ycf46/Vps4 family AAA+-type ATPase